MNSRCAFAVLFLLAVLSVPASAQEAAPGGGVPLFREPSISPDGSRFVFGHLGDVWIANADGSGADRLTDHVAYDTRPKFSPNGDLVAFSSDREGGMDVFVIPAAGGEARRVTFDSAEDSVIGWTPAGDSILFLSHRDTFRPLVYSVPPAGGQPAGWGPPSPPAFTFDHHGRGQHAGLRKTGGFLSRQGI